MGTVRVTGTINIRTTMDPERVGVLERIYEPSAIRRGRLATSPTWYVRLPDGKRWRFQRKGDAVKFQDAGGVCPNHERTLCRHCHGSEVT